MSPVIPKNLPPDRIAQIRFRETSDFEPPRMFFADTGEDVPTEDEDEDEPPAAAKPAAPKPGQ